MTDNNEQFDKDSDPHLALRFLGHRRGSLLDMARQTVFKMALPEGFKQMVEEGEKVEHKVKMQSDPSHLVFKLKWQEIEDKVGWNSLVAMTEIPLLFKLSELFDNVPEISDYQYHLAGVIAFIQDVEHYIYIKPRITSDRWYEINDYNIGAVPITWKEVVMDEYQ